MTVMTVFAALAAWAPFAALATLASLATFTALTALTTFPLTVVAFRSTRAFVGHDTTIRSTSTTPQFSDLGSI